MLRVLSVAALAGMVAAVSPAVAGQRGRTLPAPSFRPAVGWWTLSTGPTARIAPEVWAASDRGTDQEALFNLFVGLRRLSSSGIVIWASDMGRGGPTTMFTKTRWPLELGGFRLYRSWEGQPAANVQQRVRTATVAGWHLDVRVYFGTQHPTKATLAKAQAEIDRLILPTS
jgi:hypothetical protein